jgi:DNA-binding GntR family transcriptional regulator
MTAANRDAVRSLPLPPGNDVEPSLADRAYVALRDMIVTLQIPPASPIHEERLSKQLGFGRTPLREAVKRMEAEGLVAIYPRRGTFATDVNITDHRLIADIRGHLEAHAARRAAESATARDIATLSRLLETTSTEGADPHRLVALDATIHRAIYHCTHNRYLEVTLNQYYNLSLRIWYLYLDRLPDMDSHVSEHVRLLESIVAGQPDHAHALAAHHVAGFDAAIRKVL